MAFYACAPTMICIEVFFAPAFTHILHHMKAARHVRTMSQLVGAKLVADFGAHGLFVGHVQEFCSATGHLVKYEDGDEEWIKDILVSVALHQFDFFHLPSCATTEGSRCSNYQNFQQAFDTAFKKDKEQYQKEQAYSK